MDVSHHGGSAYYDHSSMDGAKPVGINKHSPNGLDSEVWKTSSAQAFAQVEPEADSKACQMGTSLLNDRLTQ